MRPEVQIVRCKTLPLTAGVFKAVAVASDVLQPNAGIGDDFIAGFFRTLQRKSDWEMTRVMARPDGFEPPATWFEARCSIQLSYGRKGNG